MILITGLDGSGKSTLLEQVQSRSNAYSILRVPHIETELFEADKELLNTSVMLNNLGKRADETKQPSLKIISMFGSMLMYQKLAHFLNKSNKVLIAERHPLIDTPVYASAYLKVMDPQFLDKGMAAEIEGQFVKELRYLECLMPEDYKRQEQGPLYSLLNYLYSWFSDSSNIRLSSLSKLFGASLPDSIYFLDAPIEILVDRLSNRNAKEYHETREQLEKMRSAYLRWFESQAIPISIQNTSNWESSSSLLEELVSIE